MIFPLIALVWLAAAFMAVQQGNTEMLYLSSLLFGAEALIIWRDAAHAQEALRLSLGVTSGNGGGAPASSRGLSALGQETLKIVEAVTYRLSSQDWADRIKNAPPLSAAVKKAEQPGKAFNEAEAVARYRNLLQEICYRLNAAAGALLFNSPDADHPLKVIANEIESAEFEGCLRHFILAHAADGSAFGLRDLDFSPSILGDFARFGLRYSICFPLGDLDSRAGQGYLWLGYTEAEPPLSAQATVANDYARQIGLEIAPQIRLWELDDKYAEVRSVDQQKSEFLAQMSHDIRSPLNNIKAILNLIRLEGVNAETSDLLQVALNNCESMNELVSDILDFSKHKAGKLESRPEVLDPGQCVAEVYDIFVVMARLKGLDFSLGAAPDGCRIKCDRRHLKRIAANLLSNALKYTSKGRVRVAIEPQGSGKVGLVVSDSGQGLTREQQQRLFVPFTTFHGQDNTAAADNVGLGLAIVRILAEVNGGEIRVASQPGKGSTFTVIFPEYTDVRLPPERPKLEVITFERQEQVAGEFSNGRVSGEGVVLVVDDDPDCVSTMARNLRLAGLKVLEAVTISDAISIVNFEKPQIVVSDIAVPDGGLRRLLEHINRRRLECCVAAVSGRLSEREHVEYTALGVKAIFNKPADVDQLLRWITFNTQVSKVASAG